MRGLCHKCGAIDARHCKDAFCPLLKGTFSQSVDFKQQFMSETPNVFVGRFGYPKVNIGFLSVESYTFHDDQKYWSKNNVSLPTISSLRSQLINARFLSSVYEPNKLSLLAQESALSLKPVDMEVKLDKKPLAGFSFGKERFLPHGPSSSLASVSLTQHVRVPIMVDKVVSDTDLKAQEGIIHLQSKYDDAYLVKLFSTAHLGIKENRKFVPTRWSITAVDDQLGLSIKEQILDFKFCYHEVFLESILEIIFFIILRPGDFLYELNETYKAEKGSFAQYMSDSESIKNRTTYASNCAGGYYAARLSILRYFLEKKVQGQALVLRVITDRYVRPMGVWVVKEAVKRTFLSGHITTESFAQSISLVEKLVMQYFSFSLDSLKSSSCFFKNVQTSLRLFDR